MIDWEAAEKSRLIKRADDLYEEQGIISRRAAVYLIIFALIVVLCGVYVMQLRKSRRTAQAPVETVTVSEEASTAMTAEAAEAEEPAEETAK